jgi:DNA mismatch endonuclease (patch repair protein)
MVWMDKISKKQRSENMRRIKSTGMKPELFVRSLVHRLGFRYRLHRHDLPGRPDLVFLKKRKIVFVHGCFWHSHSKAKCPRVRIPKSNLEYWLPKLDRNKRRDKQNVAQLRRTGWQVLTVWECQCSDSESLGQRLKRFLKENIP